MTLRTTAFAALIMAAAAALAAPAGAAATNPPSTRTAVTIAGRTQPAWFVCDTMDAPMQVVIGPRTAQGLARITLFPKSATGKPHGTDYAVGDGDPGAGQVYYTLSKGGREVGNLHAVSPGAFGPETPVVLPPLSSVEIEGARAQCRLIPGAQFMGFTARRSVAVIRNKAGLAYQTFDFAKADAHLPSAAVEGGRETRGSDGEILRFEKAGFRYDVVAPSKGRAGPATLSVFRANRLVQRETFIAYSTAF